MNIFGVKSKMDKHMVTQHRLCDKCYTMNACGDKSTSLTGHFISFYPFIGAALYLFIGAAFYQFIGAAFYHFIPK